MLDTRRGFGAPACAQAATPPRIAERPADAGDSATYGPLSGTAGGIALLGLLVFMISVFRELARKRA